MPILLNVHHLQENDVQVVGEISKEDLDIAVSDEVVHVLGPVEYDLTANLTGEAVLVQGAVQIPLRCECVRCLKPFEMQLRLDPWDLVIPLNGDDSPKIVDDCVDIAPALREDALLALPQHPVCAADCQGLAAKTPVKKPESATVAKLGKTPSAWDQLDQLKLK